MDEIPDEDRIDIRHKLYPDKLVPPSWSQIYRVWYKWQNLSTSSFEVLKTRKSYLDIAEIKVSSKIRQFVVSKSRIKDFEDPSPDFGEAFFLS